MRYCSRCGAEYLDSATSCSDCPGAELVDAQELSRRGRVPLSERDTRRFVRAAQAEDFLTAEELTRALEEAGIAVLSRDPRGGTVDSLTTGVVEDWWELRVPRADLARAQRVIAETRQQLRSTRAEAERAAEEESLGEVLPEAPGP